MLRACAADDACVAVVFLMHGCQPPIVYSITEARDASNALQINHPNALKRPCRALTRAVVSLPRVD